MWSTIGQKKALELFESSLQRKRAAHAYLLVGPAHVGKMTLARDVAMGLNCQRGVPPCGECSSCRRIASGTHCDVQIIGIGRNADGKQQTEIGIEEIRQVQHSANLPPFEGKCKVYIVDGAEFLSTEAANCLLKTLEEPAPTVVFILLTAREELLPLTVVSRCQRIELVQLPSAQAESALIEKWSVEPQRARLLARLSHGRLGWAVNATDQGWLDRHNEDMDELIATIEADIEGRFAYAAQLATEFSQSRDTVQDKLGLFLDWWHDVLLVKTGLGDAVVNVDRTESLGNMAAGLNLEEIRSCIAAVEAASAQLKQNANARLALEVFVFGLPGRAGQAKVVGATGAD
jgi:DNA polymerase III subunit delta'